MPFKHGQWYIQISKVHTKYLIGLLYHTLVYIRKHIYKPGNGPQCWVGTSGTQHQSHHCSSLPSRNVFWWLWLFKQHHNKNFNCKLKNPTKKKQNKKNPRNFKLTHPCPLSDNSGNHVFPSSLWAPLYTFFMLCATPLVLVSGKSF